MFFGLETEATSESGVAVGSRPPSEPKARKKQDFGLEAKATCGSFGLVSRVFAQSWTGQTFALTLILGPVRVQSPLRAPSIPQRKSEEEER